MKKFVIIDDYTDYCLWDHFLYDILPNLPSRPKAWDDCKQASNLPVGEWEMLHGIHQLATPVAFEKAGVPQVSFEQLPAIFCITDEGIVGRYRTKKEEAEQFLKEHL